MSDAPPAEVYEGQIIDLCVEALPDIDFVLINEEGEVFFENGQN